jgi:hypothetical protein
MLCLTDSFLALSIDASFDEHQKIEKQQPFFNLDRNFFSLSFCF